MLTGLTANVLILFPLPALAELQASRSQNATLNKRRPIGFIQPKDEDDEGDEDEK